MRSDNLHLDLNWNINCCVAVACLPLWRSCCIAFGGFLFIIEPKRQTKAVLFFISFGILECSTTACRAFNYAVDLGTYVEIACSLVERNIFAFGNMHSLVGVFLCSGNDIATRFFLSFSAFVHYVCVSCSGVSRRSTAHNHSKSRQKKAIKTN